ncbi:putative Protein kinase domain-containing protein [Seiridium unicorne]|uniref:Protein kinase domain-containing protein n=1 Tax=Seiridium unicorne TaxID=138068 RepID=A0ABR2VGT3_9PEZI
MSYLNVAVNRAKQFFTDEYDLYAFETAVGGGMAGVVVRFIWKPYKRRYTAKLWFGGAAARSREVTALQRALSRRDQAVPSPDRVKADATPGSLTHRDLHWGNVMIADFDSYREEHRLVPLIKVIDWDQARDHGDAEVETFNKEDVAEFDDELNLADSKTGNGKRNRAIEKNILDVGMLMCNLIVPPIDKRFAKNPSTCREIMLEAMSGGAEDDDCDDRPNDKSGDLYELDDHLLTLVARCLAVDPENRPSLEDLEKALETTVAQRTAQFYKDRVNENIEADRNVASIMREAWIDATSSLML